jgi:hypothetical protein
MDDKVIDLGDPEFQYHGPNLARWVVVPDDVYWMLREAGAPDPRQKPWRRNFDLGSTDIAYCMNFPLGYRLMPDGSCRIIQEGSRPRNRHRAAADRARPRPRAVRTELDREYDAVCELRRASPKNIGRFAGNQGPAYFERPYGYTNNPRVRELLKTFEEAEETRKKLLALLDSLPPRPHKKPWWYFDAARLLDRYCWNVKASAGVSPDGPAVCFIEAALKLMGYSDLPKRDGIVSALRRTRDWEYEAALQSLSYYR